MPQNSTSSAQTTRRDFVRTAAAGAAIASTAGASAIAQEKEDKLRGRPAINTDVLVCGGGCAGTAAALAAARAGAKVLLVEKAPFAGGIITCVGLPYFDGIANIKDKGLMPALLQLISLQATSQSKLSSRSWYPTSHMQLVVPLLSLHVPWPPHIHPSHADKQEPSSSLSCSPDSQPGPASPVAMSAEAMSAEAISTALFARPLFAGSLFELLGESSPHATQLITNTIRKTKRYFMFELMGGGLLNIWLGIGDTVT